MTFEHTFTGLDELRHVLKRHGVRDALIRSLSQNHNDKNQVYSGSDFRPLHPHFNLRFDERAESVSVKKAGKVAGNPILEARFVDFRWITTNGEQIQAPDVKMIIYPQYPEARLSGFKTVRNTAPASMTVDFTKQNPDAVRYLILGRRGNGCALGIMLVDPAPELAEEIEKLPNAQKSGVWKLLILAKDRSVVLHRMLSQIVGKPLRGCRFDAEGNTIPFNGTQVCGYTLEHACGIRPNSDKGGDFEGIELKAYTQNKVTLFTPEPDMGLYADSFPDFMTRYGYLDKNANYRFTGIHRAGVRTEKSELTLVIANYDSSASIASQSGNDIHLALLDDDKNLTAGWSLGRLMNCWGAKHNEVVYVAASKAPASDPDALASGYRHVVEFGNEVIWCRNTSADKLFKAIANGTIFLDPAPKHNSNDASQSKRRSQWRVNHITSAIDDLYEQIRRIRL